jgi:phage terminase large subunit
MEYLKRVDYLAYLHVWEGDCLSTVEGAIYAKEIGECEAAGHLTHIAYDPARPVVTFWDLGYGDSTAVWFVQAYPWEYRCIDYLEGDRLPLAHYQKQLQLKPYVYEAHCLPHDAQAKQLGTGKSVQELMVSAGFKVRIVPKLSILDGINAARTIFPQVWFDVDRCADGIQALRHYRWAPPGTLGIQKREPLHDWASNAADGFRYFAVGIKPQLASKPKPAYPNYQPVSAWS